MNATQLTDFRNFEAKRLIFSKPEVGTIPGSASKLTFKRVRIAIRNPDGTIGDLIVATPADLLCYGLQEQTDPSTGAVNGYQFPIVLWNRNEPSADEKMFTDTIHKIADACKEHLLSHKEEIEKYDLEANDLKKFNPLYYKMEKGKIVEGKSPMFYVKTASSKKGDEIQIRTVFADAETNRYIEPMDLLNKRCYVQGAIKIESIFVGNKISLQVKLFEARVRLVDSAFKSLLSPSVNIKKEESAVSPLTQDVKPDATPTIAPPDDEDDTDESESESESEEEDGDATEPAPPTPAPVPPSTRGRRPAKK